MADEKKENSLKNLMAPWQPGQSGNLAGKPKGSKSFKTILSELLDKKVKNIKVKSAEEIQEMFPDGDLTYKQALAVRMIAIAIINPESKSAERIMNRVEGLPKQTIEQSIVSDEAKIIISKDGETISLKVKDERPPIDTEDDETNATEIK